MSDNNNTEQIFTEIYKNNSWGSSESVSGEGSEYERTVALREELPVLFDRYNIKSILDIGCGDFNWMRKVVGDKRYLGIDIVEDLIKLNNERYGTDKIKFACKDILKLSHADFHGYDCVILRDVLVHLSFEDINYVLTQVRLGTIHYVFITNFIGCLYNQNIPTGHWRPLNMFTEPFNLGTPLFIVASYAERYKMEGCEYFDKTLTLWHLYNYKTGKHSSFVNDIVITQLKTINPLLVTDVGTGDGYWGKVTRLLFPKSKITGIELSAKWYSHCLDLGVYDKMIHGDVFDAISGAEGDVIIFGDILEHLERDRALQTLKTAVNSHSYVIVNAPVGFQPQEHEDEEEIHRCGLTYDDFCEYTILSYHESGGTAEEYKVFTILLKGKRESNDK